MEYFVLEIEPNLKWTDFFKLRLRISLTGFLQEYFLCETCLCAIQDSVVYWLHTYHCINLRHNLFHAGTAEILRNL